jgi:translation initiation factor 2B subunit (eIF-2B alpha/beta/delta family)
LLSRLKIEIVSDYSIATAVKNLDYVVLGADKVIPNGDTSSKMGSSAIAILARVLSPKCKVLALFETNKITNSGFDSEYLVMDSGDEFEVTRSWPSAYLKVLRN